MHKIVNSEKAISNCFALLQAVQEVLAESRFDKNIDDWTLGFLEGIETIGENLILALSDEVPTKNEGGVMN